MATKPRLFLSHSTQKDSVERGILTGLAEGLRDDYAILLDRETLVTGGDWRSTINLWIGACDATVILITPASIASEFCQYEWSILSYRQKIQPNFLIIPIYCGATPGDIAGKPHQLAAITAYFEYDSIPKLCADVTARLKSKLSIGDRPAEGQALFVAKLLQDAVGRVEVIDRAAARIQLDLGNWAPLTDKWMDFAVRIVGVGLERARPALRELKQYFGTRYQEQFEDLVTLIGCSWVDMASSRRIRECAALKVSKKGPLGLNAERVETAKCYVLSGSERAPRENWPVGAPHGVFGNYDDLYRQIQSALLEALNLDSEVDAAELKKQLDMLRRDQEPVFIVLSSEGLSREWLRDLCDAELFAWVNFFVLTGESRLNTGLLSDDAVLTPVLPNGFEREVWDTYDTTKRSLGIA